MAADSPRRACRYGGTIVRPQAYSDKTVMESVVDFISDVVPQAYTGAQKVEDKEKIQWVQFEKCDSNDVQRNPNLKGGDSKNQSLVLILGYSNGYQIWSIAPNGEAQEVLSLRQGPVRAAKVLPSPEPVFGKNDVFKLKRPLIAVCDSTSAGQPFCSVKFVSLKTGDEVHNSVFKSLQVINIDCNKRVVVIVFQEKLAVLDACEYKQLFWVTGCYPCPSPKVNPIALATRWLAYADKKLVSVHQSCGGMSGDGAQSYAATVISAAKSITKGLTLFGESVVSSVTGSKPQSPKKSDSGTSVDNAFRPGIISIIDTQQVQGEYVSVTDDTDGDFIIAHFHAHANEPVADMAFDPTGTLLITACKLGHNFHVFRIMAHPCSSSLGAVHHLYTLHRGDTTAKVQDLGFTMDSRWVSVSTHRGTTHVFPITAYGGTVSVRTHCNARVVNRASRFHKSAGLEDMDYSTPGRNSPVLSASPGSSGHESYPSLIRQNALNNNMGNPRLPPYPHPTTLYPLAQIKLSPLGLPTVATTGGRTQPSPQTTATVDHTCCVAATFSAPRGWVAGSPNLSVERREGRRPVDSLYVISQSGVLTEYVLDPRPRPGFVDKVSDDSPLDLVVTGKVQWSLLRSKTSAESKLPVQNNNPLVLASDAVLTQQPTIYTDQQEASPVTRHDSKDSLSSDQSSKEDMDEQWLSQVEIITHAGPHRRLWMGPQFSFKTYQNTQHTTVLHSGSSSLLSQSPDTTNISAIDIVADDCDLESLKLQPARSSPVAMPATRPAYRRSSGSDHYSPSPGRAQPNAPLYIEAGSFDQSPHLLSDVYGCWTESTQGQQPRSSCDEEEDRLRETLAEAMIESPTKDGGPASRQDELTEVVETLSGSSGSSSTGRSYLGFDAFENASSVPKSLDQAMLFPSQTSQGLC